MKNKLILIAIILMVIAAISAYLLFLPKYYMKKAQDYYKHAQYADAAFYYGKIEYKEQIDTDDLYYYADSLSKLTPSLIVQEDFFKIIEANSSSTAAYVAQQKLDELKSKTLKKFGSNYIDKAPFDTGILRWDISKMPLKVSFSSERNVVVPQYYIDYIRDSFGRWQSATGNFINFTFVGNPNDADIKVIFSDQGPVNNCNDDDCKYSLAFTQPQIRNKKLKSMEIKFRVTNAANNNFTKFEIYNIALHEIGHSLGIMGHSFDQNDIMYPVSIDKVYDVNADAYKVFRSDLTYRDVNTLMLLYKMVPDISNSDRMSYYNKDFVLPNVILGDEKVQTSQKIDQALKYIKTSPTSTEGWVDLASAYAESGLSDKAIKALDEAQKVAATPNERFNIFYNYAAIFVNDEEYNNAITYANYALDIYPDNPDAKLLIGYSNVMLKHYTEAQNVLGQLVTADPTNIDYSCNLATAYFKQFHFIKGAKVLNELVKNNPDAKNDPRIKRNFLLMNFSKFF